MGDAKYDRSSLLAMARMLFISVSTCLHGRHNRRRLSGGRWWFGAWRVRLVGGELEEDLFQAHPHRPHLQQSPSAGDDRPREVAPHVAAVLALHLEPRHAVATVRFDD